MFDRKVINIFNVGHRKTGGKYGVEIELEASNLPRDVPGWGGVHDGSLRGNALEYVMTQPRSYDITLKTLDVFYKEVNKRRGIVAKTHSSGVHVHINAQQWTIKELYTFVTAFCLVENALVAWCGRNRTGNLFCMRTRDCMSFYKELRSSVYQPELLSSDRLRYCAINLTSLFKFGSVELRCMRTPRYLPDISSFIKMLEVFTNNVKSFDSPLDVWNKAKELGEYGFIESMFGEHTSLLLSKAHTNGYTQSTELDWLGPIGILANNVEW